MATHDTETLLQRSTADRRKKRRPTVYGDPVEAGFAAREKRQILALAHTATNLAAAERGRYGSDRKPTADERADAVQDVLLAIYGDGEPVLADLIDPDRERVSTADGSRESLRPAAELIAAAGASFDRAYAKRDLLPTDLDLEAGTGSSLLQASAASRDSGEARRSEAGQLVDPSTSPIPPEVGEAIAAAGIWPDDPIRQLILDRVCGSLTAQDWLEAGERGNTPAAIRKRRSRAIVDRKTGTTVLDVLPAARTFGDALRAAIEPTAAEIAILERDHLAKLLPANPNGIGSGAAKLIDPAWRTTQPMVHPLTDGAGNVIDAPAALKSDGAEVDN